MPTPSPPEQLLANIKDVLGLFELHAKHTGTARGRRHGVEVLNKSAIVLLTACWEAFVEDIAKSGAAHYTKVLVNANRVPKEVRRPIALRLRNEKNELAPWDLASAGWRPVVNRQVAELLERFHTPKTANVEHLLEQSIGLVQVSTAWSWHGMTPAKARAQLDALVTLRGEIAHRVSVPSGVQKSVALRYSNFVQRLAVATGNSARAHIHGMTGRYPWGELAIE